MYSTFRLMMKHFLYSLVAMVSLTCDTCAQGPESRPNCMDVVTECQNDVRCGLIYHNFYHMCSTVIAGGELGCTEQCTNALVNLLKSEPNIGRKYIDCVCGGKGLCEKGRQAIMELCAEPVIETLQLDSTATVSSCRIALRQCEADTACNAAWDSVNQTCRELIQGSQCTTTCEDSVQTFVQLTKARRLIQGTCSGDEKKTYTTLVRNKDRLCASTDVPYHQVSGNFVHLYQSNPFVLFLLCIINRSLKWFWHCF